MVPLFQVMRKKIAKNYRFRSETLERKVAEWWSMKPDFKMSEDMGTLNTNNICIQITFVYK